MYSTIYDFSVQKIDQTPATLGEFKGDVLLIVNVASQCGLTPQYAGLETLFEKYRGQGFKVLGFPANEFGAQEPGEDKEIKEFCTGRFGVKFPMYSKIVVKGEGQHPLYRYLTATQPKATEKPGGDLKAKLIKHGVALGTDAEIMWNFEKFLVNRKGQVVARFAPDVAPEDPILVKAIESNLT